MILQCLSMFTDVIVKQNKSYCTLKMTNKTLQAMNDQKNARGVPQGRKAPGTAVA